jgi:hypothetical protein
MIWYSPGQRRHLNKALRRVREMTARECIEMIRVGRPAETAKVIAEIKRRFRLKDD